MRSDNIGVLASGRVPTFSSHPVCARCGFARHQAIAPGRIDKQAAGNLPFPFRTWIDQRAPAPTATPFRGRPGDQVHTHRPGRLFPSTLLFPYVTEILSTPPPKASHGFGSALYQALVVKRPVDGATAHGIRR